MLGVLLFVTGRRRPMCFSVQSPICPQLDLGRAVTTLTARPSDKNRFTRATIGSIGVPSEVRPVRWCARVLSKSTPIHPRLFATSRFAIRRCNHFFLGLLLADLADTFLEVRAGMRIHFLDVLGNGLFALALSERHACAPARQTGPSSSCRISYGLLSLQ